MKNRIVAISILGILSLITILSVKLASNLEFDYNFENFFPTNDRDTEFFFAHRSKFETDNDFVIVGIENKSGIFEYDFLEKIDHLTDSLEELHGVTKVISPTRHYEKVQSSLGLGAHKKYFLNWKRPELYEKDSIKIYQCEDLVGNYFSKDAKSVSIMLQTKQFLHKSGCDSLASQLKIALKNNTFDGVHLAGRSVGQSHYIEIMQSDLQIFVVLSLVLLIIFLSISFRSFWGVWLPILVILWSVIWVLGFMALIGKNINLLLTILPTIIFVVGISDVVHILSKYLEELRNGVEKNKALKLAFKEVGVATFLTTLTTSVGFITLISANVTPIKDFGIVTGVGVFLAYIIAFTLLPAVLILLPTPKVAKKKQEDTFWTKNLTRLFYWVIKRPKQIVIGSAILTGISLIGISQIEAETFILEDLKKDNQLRKDFEFFDTHFSGVRPLEISIWVKDTTKFLLAPRNIRGIEKLENYLKKEYDAGFLYSVNSLIKLYNRSKNGGDPAYYKLPEDSITLVRQLGLLAKVRHKDYVKPVLSSDFCCARISGKIGDWGSREIRRKNEKLEAFIEKELSDLDVNFKITGTAELIDKNNDMLAGNMIKGLIIAFLVIALIVGLMFKSFKMVVLSLIPNMLPLVLIGAIMGFTGIQLKVSTSIIFTIAFGIAVDDTIHFISKLRLELQKGKNLQYSVKRTFLSTGRAIVLTSLILCSGFLTLIGSDFLVTFYVGLLVSLALVFAVFSDLIVLPALVLLFFKKR